MSDDRALAVLAPLGGSLSDLARHGQAERLLEYYFPAYLERFARICYFSYEPESLAELTSDRRLLERVDVFAPGAWGGRRFRALELGVGPGADSRALKGCAVARALQAPGALPALLARVPYVCTYGYSYADLTTVSVAGAFARPALAAKRAAMRAGLRVLLRRSALTIVTSAAAEREAKDLGARRLARIPNGVDLSLFVPGGRDRDYDVAFVGRLVPGKDVPTLVEALRMRGRGERLVIAGGGPDRGALEAACSAAGVNATFLGNVPQRRLAAVLGRSRCFVLPSLSEGNPKVLLEAMAAGLPCIGTDIPGIRELAADGAVALFPRGDAAALAGALARVLDDPVYGAALGEAARRRAEGRFDLGRLLERETEILWSLALGRDPAAGGSVPAIPRG